MRALSKSQKRKQSRMMRAHKRVVAHDPIRQSCFAWIHDTIRDKRGNIIPFSSRKLAYAMDLLQKLGAIRLTEFHESPICFRVPIPSSQTLGDMERLLASRGIDITYGNGRVCESAGSGAEARRRNHAKLFYEANRDALKLSLFEYLERLRLGEHVLTFADVATEQSKEGGAAILVKKAKKPYKLPKRAVRDKIGNVRHIPYWEGRKMNVESILQDAIADLEERGIWQEYERLTDIRAEYQAQYDDMRAQLLLEGGEFICEQLDEFASTYASAIELWTWLDSTFIKPLRDMEIVATLNAEREQKMFHNKLDKATKGII